MKRGTFDMLSPEFGTDEALAKLREVGETFLAQCKGRHTMTAPLKDVDAITLAINEFVTPDIFDPFAPAVRDEEGEVNVTLKNTVPDDSLVDGTDVFALLTLRVDGDYGMFDVRGTVQDGAARWAPDTLTRVM